MITYVAWVDSDGERFQTGFTSERGARLFESYMDRLGFVHYRVQLSFDFENAA
jgi:hypothetical protein